MKQLIAFILLCAFTSAAYAADSPFIYSRAVLKIVPLPAAPKSPAPKKEDGNKPTEVLPQLARVAKEFTVDVRPPQFLAQQDYIALQPFTDQGGMLILFDPPQMASLKSANMLAKADVLFLLDDGVIDKIAPELSLKNLPEPVQSDKPVRAFLFLKAGMTKTSDIHPGDHVENSLFRTHAVVIEGTK